MPYFISDKNADCSGWAVEKEDGEVIGCHTTKQDAIDQMVAVSIAEDMEPGGERALPDNYRPALAEDVPEGRACGNCVFYDESRQNDDGTKAWCEKWDDFVDGAFYCNAWQSTDVEVEMNRKSVSIFVRSILTCLSTSNRLRVKVWTITVRSWRVRELLPRLFVRLVRWLLVGSQKTR